MNWFGYVEMDVPPRKSFRLAVFARFTGRSIENRIQTRGKLNVHISSYNLPHVRVGVGNDPLNLTDLLDTR